MADPRVTKLLNAALQNIEFFHIPSTGRLACEITFHTPDSPETLGLSSSEVQHAPIVRLAREVGESVAISNLALHTRRARPKKFRYEYTIQTIESRTGAEVLLRIISSTDNDCPDHAEALKSAKGLLRDIEHNMGIEVGNLLMRANTYSHPELMAFGGERLEKDELAETTRVEPARPPTRAELEAERAKAKLARRHARRHNPDKPPDTPLGRGRGGRG